MVILFYTHTHTHHIKLIESNKLNQPANAFLKKIGERKRKQIAQSGFWELLSNNKKKKKEEILASNKAFCKTKNFVKLYIYGNSTSSNQSRTKQSGISVLRGIKYFLKTMKPD